MIFVNKTSGKNKGNGNQVVVTAMVPFSHSLLLPFQIGGNQAAPLCIVAVARKALAILL